MVRYSLLCSVHCWYSTNKSAWVDKVIGMNWGTTMMEVALNIGEGSFLNLAFSLSKDSIVALDDLVGISESGLSSMSMKTLERRHDVM